LKSYSAWKREEAGYEVRPFPKSCNPLQIYFTNFLKNIYMYILIIITYLGGSAWGPQVSMQEFSSKNSCASARTLVMKMTDEMNKTNLAGGTSRREIISAECIKK
jgi:hypothetical protein